MRKLLIFSGWISSNSVDKEAWSQKYGQLLASEFNDIDKVITFNRGCDQSLKSVLNSASNVMAMEDVPEALDIGSDAAGYQFGLSIAKDFIDRYDTIIFAHSKGASHSFSEYSQIIDDFRSRLFCPGKLEAMAESSPASLYVTDAFMTPNSKSIRDLSTLCQWSDVASLISICVTSSIFAVSATTLGCCISKLPDNFLSSNLETMGFDRWFFENAFPSLLLAHCGNIVFTDPNQLDAELNPYVCYHAAPRHNGAVIARALKSAASAGEVRVSPIAVPFSFAANPQDRSNFIAYDPGPG